MENILSFKTKFGWINIIEENQSIVSLSFGKVRNKGFSNNLNKLKKNIRLYFSGKKILSKNSLKILGNPIQKKIWNELKKIPYGKTKSYGEIAKKVNTSARYVGRVCGQNKLLLLIPCHRVVRSDGKLGGFSGLGGIKLKKSLLDLENKHFN
tara:strand:+ start:93 stop:548 length:456 start_codon:yes stop_codon:yes gene_type:complete